MVNLVVNFNQAQKRPDLNGCLVWNECVNIFVTNCCCHKTVNSKVKLGIRFLDQPVHFKSPLLQLLPKPERTVVEKYLQSGKRYSSSDHCGLHSIRLISCQTRKGRSSMVGDRYRWSSPVDDDDDDFPCFPMRNCRVPNSPSFIARQSVPTVSKPVIGCWVKFSGWYHSPSESMRSSWQLDR